VGVFVTWIAKANYEFHRHKDNTVR
jgi:hypothetical protein